MYKIGDFVKQLRTLERGRRKEGITQRVTHREINKNPWKARGE